MDDKVKYTTDYRFNLTRSEVNIALGSLREQGIIDDSTFEKTKDEDSFLVIKYRTYKKCKTKIGIGGILIICGFYFQKADDILFWLIVAGFILTLSSFFGILSNKLTKNQINYLNK